MPYHKTKLILSSLLISCLSFILFTCSPAQKSVQKKTETTVDSTVAVDPLLLFPFKQIRVLLFEELKTSALRCKVSVKVSSGDRFFPVPKNQKMTFVTEGEIIKISQGKNKLENEIIEISPQQEGDLINFENNKFYGSFRLQIVNGKICLINVLDLNKYIACVAASEMGNAVNKNDIEMIKAFTICIRNYSIQKLQERKPFFDVYDDIRDQVYNGATTGKEYFEKAVYETDGFYLSYRNLPAHIFYFSYCGGSTEDCENVFPEKISYLSSVKDGIEPNCGIVPNFNWEQVFTSKEIIQLLINAGYLSKGDNKLVGVSINGRYPSERVRELVLDVFVNDEYKSIVLKGNKIRYVLKNSKGGLLKSTLFDVAILKEDGKLSKVKFSGKGNGHGVGLCQWGAIGLSRKGKSFLEILSFYFPKLQVKKLINA